MPLVDITVIGGGISGMLSAYYLNQAGFKVEVLERGSVGRESSWAGGGILSPLYPWRYKDAVSQLARWGHTHYPELTEKLYAATRIDPEYIRSGFLLLNVNDIKEAKIWADKWQMQIGEIDQEKISELEPELKNKFKSALWMSKVAQIRNPKLMQALKTYLIQNSVNIKEQTEVVKLIKNQHKISAVKTGKEVIKVNQLVVAGGAWTSKILDKFKANINVSPVRGQMIMFNTPQGLLRRISILDQHYLIPRKDGRVLFGSTLEHAGFDKTTSDKARETLRTLAIDMAPMLKTMPIERHWAGLRPGSDEGIPYIGQHPEFENLYINAGHFRNGVILGPASAQLLSNLVSNKEPVVDPEPYSIKN